MIFKYGVFYVIFYRIDQISSQVSCLITCKLKYISYMFHIISVPFSSNSQWYYNVVSFSALCVESAHYFNYIYVTNIVW